MMPSTTTLTAPVQATPAPPGPALAGSSTDLRPMMAAFPTGVSIITAVAADGRPLGMTCSSLCSASLAPPEVIACLRCGSPTLAAIRRSGAFTLNLLQSHASSVARLFASGQPDRFDHVRWAPGPAGCGPQLTGDAHTIGDFAVTAIYPVGDHDAVVGRVLSIQALTQPEPLMYGLRRFRTWTTEAAEPSGDA